MAKTAAPSLRHSKSFSPASADQANRTAIEAEYRLLSALPVLIGPSIEEVYTLCQPDRTGRSQPADFIESPQQPFPAAPVGFGLPRSTVWKSRSVVAGRPPTADPAAIAALVGREREKDSRVDSPHSSPSEPRRSRPLPPQSPNGDSSSLLSISTPRLPFSPRDPAAGSRRWKVQNVPLAGRAATHVHELSVTRYVSSPAENPRVREPIFNVLLIVNDARAGLARFAHHLEPVSGRQGWRVYAIDLPGIGLGSRTPFALPASPARGRVSPDERALAAEDWFVDAIEQWRATRQVKAFTLLGHGLAGYFCTAYALKYPGRVKKLMLSSPPGFTPPEGRLPQTPRPASRALSRSGSRRENPYDTQPTHVRQVSGGADPDLPAPRARPDLKWTTKSFLKRIFSPRRQPSSSLSRPASPVPGPDSAVSQTIRDYIAALAQTNPVDELALDCLLAPDGTIRLPLLERMDLMGWQPLSTSDRLAILGPAASSLRTTRARQPAPAEFAHVNSDHSAEQGVPVVFFLSESDDEDRQGAERAVRRLTRLAQTRIPGGLAADPTPALGFCPAKISTVPAGARDGSSGHADDFNDLLLTEMADIERRESQAHRRRFAVGSAQERRVKFMSG